MRPNVDIDQLMTHVDEAFATLRGEGIEVLTVTGLDVQGQGPFAPYPVAAPPPTMSCCAALPKTTAHTLSTTGAGMTSLTGVCGLMIVCT